MLLDILGLETFLNYEYLDIYSFLGVFLLLLIASYFDTKTLKIPNELNLSFFMIRFMLASVIGLGIGNYLGLLVGCLIILIPAMAKMKPMGGDIKMMSVIGFYSGYQNVLMIMILAIIFSAIYYGTVFLRKKEFKDIPLAPFILTAFITLLLIDNLIIL